MSVCDGAFVTLRWVLSFLLCSLGVTLTADEMEGWVSLVLLRLHMLFDKVCIVQKPPPPALHRQKSLVFFNSKMEKLSLSKIYSICYCQKCKNKQTKNPTPLAHEVCRFLTWAGRLHPEAHGNPFRSSTRFCRGMH